MGIAGQRWPQPTNEDEFEELCLLLLQEHWQVPSLERYGHRGERQYGVDLWDPEANAPRRVVQCKHHRSAKTLPPAELSVEVAKALQFPHRIEHYVVATTAKRSAATADRVGQLNEEHKASGKFRVAVLYWDDLERLISRSVKAQELLNTAPVAATVQQVATAAQQIVDTSSSERASVDVAEIKRRIARGRLADAKELIGQLRTQKWHTLARRQQASVLTNLALIQEELGQAPEAAGLLLQAFDLASDEEVFWSNRIFALTLLRDGDGARGAALAFVERFPNSPAARAALVQTAEPEEFRSIVESLPEWALRTEEVVVSVAERASDGTDAAHALQCIHEAAAFGTMTLQNRYRVARSCDRRQLFLQVGDNYFCRAGADGRSATATTGRSREFGRAVA